MKNLKFLPFFLIALFISGLSVAQDFEGVILMKETHRGNVITKRISVKGNKVLLETFTSEKMDDLKGAKIVDLESGKITALLPSRKLYFDVPNRPGTNNLSATVEATGKTKNIAVNKDGAEQGYTCKQVLVKSKARNAGVSFWLANGNFTFFAKLMQTLNKKDNISNFFNELAEKHPGTLPMLSVERRSDGTEVSTRQVVEITETTVEDSTFDIPEDYSLQER